jgi:hypothetical protein
MKISDFYYAFSYAFKEQYQLWLRSRRATSTLTRLYIYSIAFDPFLFFLLADRITLGFSMGLSRLFIITFYLLWFFNMFRLRLFSPLKHLNNFWKIFCIFILYAILLNLLLIATEKSFLSMMVLGGDDTATAFALFLNGTYIRVSMELFILIFVISHYFWVASKIITKTEHFEFLCATFLLLCYVSLLVGLLNIFLAYTFDYNFLPRHLAEYFYEEPSLSGVRFKGLAGEPRDAFGQLVLFLVAFKFMRLIGLVKISTTHFSLINILTFLAIFLTFSASGFVAIFIFTFLFLILQVLSKFTIEKFILSIYIFSVLTLLTFISFEFIDRLVIYKDAFIDLFELLESGDELPSLIMTQFVNIYPVLYWWQSCSALNFWTCFLGGGIGTSFALNSIYYNEGINNANSYMSRLIPELGALGFFLFLYVCLIVPLKQVNIIVRRSNLFEKNHFKFFPLFILALFSVVMAHKSNIMYFGYLILFVGLHFFNWRIQARSATLNN